jgi:hypothetical protein
VCYDNTIQIKLQEIKLILIDYNQIMLASLFVSIGNHTNAEIDENMIRHMSLNSIRANRKKFSKDYGELVICADGKNTWRKSVFPYYKANRKKSREESELDWGELYRIIGLIREELSEFFPYKVLHFEGLEADDIIGTLCHEFGTPMNSGEPILILSGDKDYIQLQKYGNISQYNPVLKKWVRDSDPDKFLFEHIVRGDKGDGVPNILSSDNSIVVGDRQKAITQKKLDLFFKNPESMDELTKTRFARNKMLIDLESTPDNYKKLILDEYSKEKTIGRSKLFNYFLDKRLRNLLTDIQDF